MDIIIVGSTNSKFENATVRMVWYYYMGLCNISLSGNRVDGVALYHSLLPALFLFFFFEGCGCF